MLLFSCADIQGKNLMRRAFVSHSTADDSYVAEMESFLRAADFDDVFNDVSSIKPDEQFWPEIERGIGACETLFVVITSASNDSAWVKREVEYARSLSKKIIPIWIEDCPVPSIFAGRDVIDFRPRTRQARRIEIDRIGKYAPAELIGREDETKLLNEAWQQVLRFEKGRPHVLTFVALGGEGKTSLVAKWAASLAHDNWPGCDAVFAWSFYSQGTREQTAVSSDLFLAEALTFFGDAALAGSAQGAFEKGKRLAQLVGERRALLILDGLEPLQYAPTSPTPGELKDQGLSALLKGLAATSHGLCVVTTRYALPDLRAFQGKSAREEKLTRLSTDAGVALLQSFGVQGSLRKTHPSPDGRTHWNEFERLVEDVKGHALTLSLLGSFLRDAHTGDIRRRDLIKLEEADAEELGGHAFHVMDAYVQSFESGGKTEEDHVKGQRALAILRLLGLFDRPATSDCLEALWKNEAIAGLSEPLTNISEAQRNLSLQRLEDARLLTVNRDASHKLIALDAHPLLREYFGQRLRAQRPEAWHAAHRRLYEHLCAATPDKPNATLEDLQPLYQAVAHGCLAGAQQEAYECVLRKRIFRGHPVVAYSWVTLGAVRTDLGALACFFEGSYDLISPSLGIAETGEVLGLAGFLFCISGQLEEGVNLLTKASRHEITHDRLLPAARATAVLATYQLLKGKIECSISNSEQAGRFAEQCSEREGWDLRMRHLGSLGDAYHQAGNIKAANKFFVELEQLRSVNVSPLGNLALLGSFQHCDYLLAPFEQGAWKCVLASSYPKSPSRTAINEQVSTVIRIANDGLKRARDGKVWSLVGLNLLTLFRVKLYQSIKFLTSNSTLVEKFKVEGNDITDIGNLLHSAGQRQYIPLGLLTRAWLHSLTGARTGPESAQTDLDEAWEIAERGPMPLFLADIHLHRARLFLREAKYPWESPQHDLAEARRLIYKHDYLRRKDELEDAEKALNGK
ncbi:MAG: hypothetical protein B7Z37_10955 [Verrucomicrobia bacterium 12-59-8]|nr:MAG: hypothetical protein B7Z37_10955 [Verrucomicrobia bacterium 12-59-8]